MNEKHLTNDQLQMFVDKALLVDEADNAQHHLNSCDQCRKAVKSLRRLDVSLATLPIERVNSDFTRQVLKKLGIAPETSMFMRLAENLAYGFGLLIVLGVMLAVFVLTGVIETQQLAQTQGFVTEISSAFIQKIDSATIGFAAALRTYLPFMFGNASVKIALMGTIVVGMLAMLDRFVKRRFRL